MAEIKKFKKEFAELQESLLEQTRQIQSLKILVMEKNFMLENLNSEIAAMKDSNKNDMEVLKNVLSEQVVLLKKVAQDLFPSDKYSAIFPITIQRDLDDVEYSITAESHDQM
ncbi:PREDICTED: uncharacterized protein LOC108356607, partial [Rhagoletis zephyria]